MNCFRLNLCGHGTSNLPDRRTPCTQHRPRESGRCYQERMTCTPYQSEHQLNWKVKVVKG